MKRSLTIAIVLASIALAPSHAQTTKSRSSLTSEINATFPDQMLGAITPAIARSTYLDMLASWSMINATSPGDANYPMVAGDRYVYTTTLSAARVWTLPPANSLNKGEVITVADAFSVVTPTNTISVARNGGDSILGGTTPVLLNVAGSSVSLETDGVSNWSIVSLGTGIKTPLAYTACTGANSASNYTAGTGFGCNANLANLTTADQVITGGANTTPFGLSTGSIQPDCGVRGIQYVTNNGAFTLTAPANDTPGCIVLVRNTGSAGTITFSGFSVGANTGDNLTTVNGSKFSIFVWRITDGTGTVSGYRVAAHQ